MLVNKTVGFFLSEVVGLGEMPTTKSPGQAAGRDGSEQMLGRGRCRGCRGWARQWAGEMPAGAEAGTGRDADDQITGAGREQINSKESAL